ncbi:tRNA (guanosine(18)-2'-O)-methyltransferase TrmH [Litoribacillus peritrichatus]|uniref:tRNA (guanosine(18)-2'-O)-methyltransferase n=1 Tax=Litoribacillus peritrichatus TaxID=718191 RepID=A0ABP7LZP7_9GAMM
MTPERFEKLQKTLRRRQPDLRVLTDHVHKPHNIAAIVRTCDAMGIAHLHMVWPHDQFGHYGKTASGSDRWVTVHPHQTSLEAIQQQKKEGRKVIAAHFSDRAIDFRDYDYTQPTTLLLGQELFGVSDESADLCDEHVVIPMQGMVESFNVSVAAAIILSEAQRQRQQAGMFDELRLDQKEYETTLFQWAHPQVAKFCDKKNLPYPPLDEDGDIENAAQWSQSVRELPQSE